MATKTTTTLRQEQGGAKTSRGLRNNNPLNIRHGKSQWMGMSRRQTDKAFVQFDAREWGYRAAFLLLKNYILKRAANTIGKIISRWAPSSDGNNTQAYIDYVSRTTGIGAGEKLQADDKEKMVEIVRSMAQVESGIVEDKKVLEKAWEKAKE